MIAAPFRFKVSAVIGRVGRELSFADANPIFRVETLCHVASLKTLKRNSIPKATSVSKIKRFTWRKRPSPIYSVRSYRSPSIRLVRLTTSPKKQWQKTYCQVLGLFVSPAKQVIFKKTELCGRNRDQQISDRSSFRFTICLEVVLCRSFRSITGREQSDICRIWSEVARCFVVPKSRARAMLPCIRWATCHCQVSYINCSA